MPWDGMHTKSLPGTINETGLQPLSCLRSIHHEFTKKLRPSVKSQYSVAHQCPSWNAPVGAFQAQWRVAQSLATDQMFNLHAKHIPILTTP